MRGWERQVRCPSQTDHALIKGLPVSSKAGPVTQRWWSEVAGVLLLPKELSLHQLLKLKSPPD